MKKTKIKTCNCKRIPATFARTNPRGKEEIICNSCYRPVSAKTMKARGIDRQEVIDGYGGHRRNCVCEICETERRGGNEC